MKNRYFIIGLIFWAFCISCEDESPEYSFCESYEQGQIVLGTKDGISLEKYFDIMNSYELTISKIGGNEYESSLPIEDVVDFLNTKDYINHNGFNAYKTYISTVAFLFWNMAVENQKDWAETKSTLKLTEKSSISRYLVITVPIGQEKKWATHFKNKNSFNFAELNCIYQIEPY